MSKLPPGVDKLPAGIEIHGNKLRVCFPYQGKRRREPLPIAKITKQSIAYAEKKRDAILVEIQENRFDYLKHFPNTKAKFISDNSNTKLTVEKAIEDWLAIQKQKKAATTYVNYERKAKKVKARWPDPWQVSHLKKSDLEKFQLSMIDQGLAPKTVNDVFTIVRGILGMAFDDGFIDFDPSTRVKNFILDHSDETADPFTKEEQARLLENTSHLPQLQNMLKFTMWTGLSKSEVIALAWEDIDLEKMTVKVQRAKPDSEYKVTKEKSRTRVIELLEPARDALLSQRPFTFMQQPESIEVKQRDNMTKKKAKITLVFKNENTGEGWYPDTLNRIFSQILKKAKIRARGVNQCRHTFASQMLTNHIPRDWIVRQMGHSNDEMLKRHYARFITEDMPDLASKFSELLGLDKDGYKEEKEAKS